MNKGEPAWRKWIRLARECKSDDECWEVPNTPNGNRRTVHFCGKELEVYRIMFLITIGPILDGFEVCHSCDNGKCCNPKHLFLGTRSDNVQDMYNKGRGRENFVRGENHGRSKLTNVAREQIRVRRAQGEKLKVLAKEFGVTQSNISAICCVDRKINYA